MAYSVSQVHGASGREWILEPPVRAEDALEDLRCRLAHAMGVGALQAPRSLEGLACAMYIVDRGVHACFCMMSSENR